MKPIHLMIPFVAGTAILCVSASAQAPSVNIDPQRHGNLAAAQQSIVQAYSSISNAQRDNDGQLGGHAMKAKELLSQASEELRLAADTANQDQQSGPPSGPPSDAPPANSPPGANSGPSQQPSTDLSGKWTIYAYNVNQPGSSLKTIQIIQQGNIISGTFHGPHQHGKLQGWINGSHIEFSTDTHDVLTFRGDLTQTGMAGLYGVNGQHANWTAERTN